MAVRSERWNLLSECLTLCQPSVRVPHLLLRTKRLYGQHKAKKRGTQEY